MRRAVAMRDRALGIVCHDLGNPLSTIQVCATALLDREPPDVSGMRHMAQLIQRSAAWMERIIEGLLDRSSLDAGRLRLDRESTEVSEVVGALEVMFAPLAVEQELDFVVEGVADLPSIDVDRNRLLQVLSNLLGNAMKFTDRGGRVTLSARLADQESEAGRRTVPRTKAVRFAVIDTGRGIPPDEQRHVFDWFWHSGRPEHGGRGLGLAIAAGLVEAHGDRLRVDSTVGRGSTFWFTVPTVTAP
jgi:signal transduction histidine kinase